MHKLRSIIIGTIVGAMLLYSCTTEVPETTDTAFKAHYQSTFSDVRKAINTTDGAHVFVGMDEGVPAVLILNSDFSARYFHRYSDYGPGCFQNVCEMSNGDIAMAGYTQSRELSASPFNSNPLMIRINSQGVFQKFFTDTASKGNDQFTAISSLKNEGLLLSKFQGWTIGTYRLDANSKQTSIYDKFIWNLNGNLVNHGYISAQTVTPNGNFFHVGNYAPCKTCLTMSIFSYSTFSDSLAVDPSKFITYSDYNRSGWSNSSLWKPIRGEIVDTDVEGQYYYGTSNYSDGKYSILLLNLNEVGGINSTNEYFGTGQAVFQNMVRYSDGYLLVGSTVDSTKSFKSNNYDLYILAIDPNGNMLWDETIVTENKAESALTAIEKNGVICVSGYSIDNNISSFFQLNYNLEGKLIK